MRAPRNVDGDPQRKSKTQYGSILTSGYADFVKLAVRAIAGVIGVVAIIAGFLYSTKPHTTGYLVALVSVLVVIDLELYWVHSLNHKNDFFDLALIWLGACGLFLASGSIYSGFTEGTPLFPSGGLRINEVDPKSLIVALGPIPFAPRGNEQFLNGIPTPLIAERDGKGPLYFYVRCDRFCCDFDMYSGAANYPIVVKRNRIAKPLPNGWDANGNDDAIEVVNAQNNPVFQMYYDGPNKIVINGVFESPHAVFIAGGIDEKGFRIILRGHDPIKFQQLLQKELRGYKLNRLFKYPAAVFRGVPIQRLPRIPNPQKSKHTPSIKTINDLRFSIAATRPINPAATANTPARIASTVTNICSRR